MTSSSLPLRLPAPVDRMHAATVAQLREAVRLHREGHDVGVFLPAVIAYLRFVEAAA